MGDCEHSDTEQEESKSGSPGKGGLEDIAQKQIAVPGVAHAAKKLCVMGRGQTDETTPVRSEVRSLVRDQNEGEELWQQVESIFTGLKTEPEASEVTVKEEPVDPSYEDSSTTERLLGQLSQARGALQTQQTYIDEQTQQITALEKELEEKERYLQEKDTALQQLGNKLLCLATRFHCLNDDVQKFAQDLEKVINETARNTSS